MELKACPFCGDEATYADMGSGRIHIVCNGCPVRIGDTWGDTETKEYLTEAWNRRA